MNSAKTGITDEYISYILKTYSASVIRLCYTYLKNTHDAEDIAQDTFLEVIRHGEQFDEREYEKAWIFRTAINKCLNHLKSGWVKRTTELEDNIAEYDKDIEGTDTANDVMDAVMRLPEKYRIIIHLFYYNNLSIKEIADVINEKTATVGTRLARGRELLREMLREEMMEL